MNFANRKLRMSSLFSLGDMLCLKIYMLCLKAPSAKSFTRKFESFIYYVYRRQFDKLCVRINCLIRAL